MESFSSSEIYSFVTIAICLILSSFFSAAETAITSLGAQKVKYLIKTRGEKVYPLKLWLTNPGRVLTTILIFNNSVNILASATATVLATYYFAEGAVGIATAIITILVLIFGEIIPKSFAKSHAEATAIVAMRIIKVLEFLIRPLTRLLSWFTDGVINAISEEGNKTPPMTEEELEFLVSESEKAGVIEDLKRDIIEGAFEFDDTKVREIMTPRTDLTAVPESEPFSSVLALCLETGHSRIPVYNEKIDHITGVVLAKDLLKALATPGRDRDKIKITDIMREALFVPESKSIMEAFKDLKNTKNHLAIIIDEYGGTAGIVTMEDILEEIVGEIQDETDHEEDQIITLDENVFEMPGFINIFEVIEFLGFEETDFEIGEADTLGGWLTQNTSNLPEIGQTVTIGPLTLEVLEIDRHRIEKVKITKNLEINNSETKENMVEA